MENIEPYLYIFWAQDKPKMIRNLLAALEKGQDEMINAVKPPKLKRLMEPYRNIANSNSASGTLLSIIKYLFLSLTTKNPILNIDLNNTLCFLLVVSNSMDHLSISARQELKTLLETDKNRVVEQRVLPDHYYSQLVIKNMLTNRILNFDQR